MNVYEFVLGIILIITVGKIVQVRYGGARREDEGSDPAARPAASAPGELARLREEVRSLRERVQVLERVVTDNESGARIDREIEQLRSKDRV